MKNNHVLLHYNMLEEFRVQFFEDVLTKQNMNPEMLHFDKFKKIMTDEDEKNANFAGYEFQKDGDKYLVRTIFPENSPENGQTLDIKNMLPIKIGETNPISYKNTVYHHVKDITSLKIKSEKTMNFKELVNNFAAYHHTMPDDYRLYWMLILTAYFDRCYFRISTEPNFGKDGAIKVLELLKADATSTNASVSRAKLEYLTSYKTLGVTEIADLTAEDWRNMEQFLLDVAAFLPRIPKRSRAYKGVNEILDISDFSVLLLYNELVHYSDPSRFFDNRAKTAVDDRFPALRFAGRIDDTRLFDVEDLNPVKEVENHKRDYRKLFYALKYWEDNFLEEQKEEWSADWYEYPNRWQKNLKRLTKTINLYAESEEEFNKFVDLLQSRLDEYKDMLMFGRELDSRLEGFSEADKQRFLDELDKVPLYKDKLVMLRNPAQNSNASTTLSDF